MSTRGTWLKWILVSALGLAWLAPSIWVWTRTLFDAPTGDVAYDFFISEDIRERTFLGWTIMNLACVAIAMIADIVWMSSGRNRIGLTRSRKRAAEILVWACVLAGSVMFLRSQL